MGWLDCGPVLLQGNVGKDGWNCEYCGSEMDHARLLRRLIKTVLGYLSTIRSVLWRMAPICLLVP
jgi:hypothetical protein